MPYTYSATIKNRVAERIGVRGLAVKVGEIDVSDYNSSLDPILEISKGFREVYAVTLGGFSDNGYAVAWDISNKSVKAFYPIAAEALAFTGTDEPAELIVEEVQVVSGDEATLDNLPAYIVAIDVTAGNVTGPFHAIPVGETPLTLECAVNFASGLLTFVSSDTVTSVSVTYFPQRAGTWTDPAHLVIDEAVTAAAAKANLNDQALCVQYVYNNTDSVRCVLEPSDEAPSATHTAVIDIDDGSNGTTIDSNAADESNSLKVTYIKLSALESVSDSIGDAEISLSGDPEQWDFIEEGNFPRLVVPGFGTQFVGETGASANVEMAWSGPSRSAGAGVPVWKPGKNQIITQESTAVGTTAMQFFQLPLDSGPTPAGAIGAVTAAAAQEVANGVDIGVVTFTAWGRI